jgi:hypothetical protein
LLIDPKPVRRPWADRDAKVSAKPIACAPTTTLGADRDGKGVRCACHGLHFGAQGRCADSAASAKARASAAIKAWALPRKDKCSRSNTSSISMRRLGYGRGLRLIWTSVAKPVAFACDDLPIA